MRFVWGGREGKITIPKRQCLTYHIHFNLEQAVKIDLFKKQFQYPPHVSFVGFRLLLPEKGAEKGHDVRQKLFVLRARGLDLEEPAPMKMSKPTSSNAILNSACHKQKTFLTFVKAGSFVTYTATQAYSSLPLDGRSPP